jgi:hypothetical protein
MEIKMRLKITAMITGLLTVIGAALGIGIQATPASAQVSVNICFPPTSDTTGTGNNAQCWNDRNGAEQNGNAIQFWRNDAEGEMNNAWAGSIIGTVKDGEGGVFWPFQDGSQLNSRYNGDPVYQFNLAKNENWCASQSGFSVSRASGILTLQFCTSSTAEDFVYSSEHFIVCAAASNEMYTQTGSIDNPVWASSRSSANQTNGTAVWMNLHAYLDWSIRQLV